MDSLSIDWRSWEAEAEGDTGKLKFFGKIGHWFSAYGMSAPDFMEEEIANFRSKAFAQVYIEGKINFDTWVFNKLNRVTEIRFRDKRELPYLLFDINFTPSDDKLNDYKLSVTLSGSSQITINLRPFEKKLNAALKELGTMEDPSGFLTGALQSKIAETLDALAERLGDRLAPNVLVKYFRGSDSLTSVFFDGQEIVVYPEEGDYVELEAVDRDGNLLPSEDLKWTNAQASGSKGIVDLSETNIQQIALRYKNDNAANNLFVTVKRFQQAANIKDLMKEILIQLLTREEEKVQKEITSLREDSAQNATTVAAELQNIENGNYPLEVGADELISLYDDLKTEEDTTAFHNDEAKRKSFSALRKHRKLKNNIRRKVNVAAFVNLAVEEPEKLKVLLDILTRQSGRLIARLVAGRDADGARDEVRDVIIQFLNTHLERIANDNFGFQTEYEIPLAPIYAPPQLEIPPFDPNKTLFMSDKVDFEGKQEFLDQVRAYQASLDTPTFITINYSQDLGLDSFRERAKFGRAKGIPPNYRHISIWVVNVPGSVKTGILLNEDIGDAASVLLRWPELITIDIDEEEINLAKIGFMTPTGVAVVLTGRKTSQFRILHRSTLFLF